jgi:protein phosphatase
MTWGHVLLLCSDGLTRHVTDERIRDVLRSMTSARQACETLLREALDGGHGQHHHYRGACGPFA